MTDQSPLYCGLCGKSQHEVLKLIQGSHALICNECVALCVDICNVEARTARRERLFLAALQHGEGDPMVVAKQAEAWLMEPAAFPEAQPVPAVAADNWRPIETAPKDGTAVLLAWAIDADGNPIDWTVDPTTAGVYVQVASWWEFQGWTVYCDMVQEPKLHFTPTHWQPLLAPPSGKVPPA